jgi:hypothetical protein
VHDAQDGDRVDFVAIDHYVMANDELAVITTRAFPNVWVLTGAFKSIVEQGLISLDPIEAEDLVRVLLNAFDIQYGLRRKP